MEKFLVDFWGLKEIEVKDQRRQSFSKIKIIDLNRKIFS